MPLKDCLEYVKNLFKEGEHNLSKHIQLIADAQELFAYIAKILAPLFGTDLDPNK